MLLSTCRAGGAACAAGRREHVVERVRSCRLFAPLHLAYSTPRARSHFYALLLPLTLPVTVVAVFLNWLCLKFFKHA